MFCPSCGKEGKGLCIDCFLKKNPLRMKDIELQVCGCGNTYFQGSWDHTLEDVVDKLIEKNLIIPDSVNLIDYSFESSVSNKIIDLNGRKITILNISQLEKISNAFN